MKQISHVFIFITTLLQSSSLKTPHISQGSRWDRHHTSLSPISEPVTPRPTLLTAGFTPHSRQRCHVSSHCLFPPHTAARLADPPWPPYRQHSYTHTLSLSHTHTQTRLIRGRRNGRRRRWSQLTGRPCSQQVVFPPRRRPVLTPADRPSSHGQGERPLSPVTARGGRAPLVTQERNHWRALTRRSRRWLTLRANVPLEVIDKPGPEVWWNKDCASGDWWPARQQWGQRVAAPSQTASETAALRAVTASLSLCRQHTPSPQTSLPQPPLRRRRPPLGSLLYTRPFHTHTHTAVHGTWSARWPTTLSRDGARRPVGEGRERGRDPPSSTTTYWGGTRQSDGVAYGRFTDQQVAGTCRLWCWHCKTLPCATTLAIVSTAILRILLTNVAAERVWAFRSWMWKWTGLGRCLVML